MMRFRDMPLSKDIAANLLPQCSKKSFLKNEIIIFKDDPSDEVYYVMKGTAKAISLSCDGKSAYFMDFEAGDIFGYYATFTGKPRTATIIAQSDMNVGIIPARKFIEFVSGDPKRAQNMMFYLTSHLRINSLRLSRNATMSAPERIAAYLVFMMEEDNCKTVRLDNREDCASQLEVTRETLSRALNKFEDEGLIALHSHGLEILKPEGLYRLFSNED